MFSDFNNDGWPDLLVANKVGGPDDRDMLYINNGASPDGDWQGFTTVTYQLSPAFGADSPAAMGIDTADFDNDGDLDIYITDSSPGFNQAGENDLWVNQLSETGELSFYHSDMLPAVYSWGAQWQDFDNDGWIDLHVASNWLERDYLYMNRQGTFEEMGVQLGIAQVRNTRGDLSADYDHDGWIDLFEINPDGGLSALYRNNFHLSSDHAFLVLRLVGDPSRAAPFRSTRDAVGARVMVAADLNGDGHLAATEVQLREVISGNGNAAGTSSLCLELGLGRAREAQVEVRWPSGRLSTHSLPANQHVTLVEGSIHNDHNDSLVLQR